MEFTDPFISCKNKGGDLLGVPGYFHMKSSWYYQLFSDSWSRQVHDHGVDTDATNVKYNYMKEHHIYNNADSNSC